MADFGLGGFHGVLSPAIFVGVGTSGAQVIGYLQRMIYEEYLQDDLPILQTVAIITNEDDRQYLARVVDRQDSYRHLTVPSTQALLDRVERDLTPDARALGRWLPDQLGDHPGFNAGSNNIRFAGKLHLWNNCETVTGFLQQARDACTSDQAINQSNTILQRRLQGAKDTMYVRAGNPDVYVIGSLCGGTCSGMAADLGFLLKHKLNIPHPVGIFTIPSTSDINGNLDPNLASNAYAALTEFDYWYRSLAGKPDITLPDGDTIPGNSSFPYRHICLESVTTVSGQVMTGHNGTDLAGLNQMIALNLFLEACAGTHTYREGERSDYTATLTSPTLLDGKEHRPRAYWSFGASMITYPKYTIAMAAAARAVCREIELLLDDKTESDVIQTQTRAAHEAIAGRNGLLDQLYLREGEKGLLEIVNDACRNPKLLELTKDELTRLLEVYPREEPFRVRLGDLGSFALRVSTQYANNLRAVIQKRIDSGYRSFRLQCATRHSTPSQGGTGYGLYAASEWLDKLRALLDQQRTALGAAKPPTIAMKAVTDKLDRVRHVETDPWLALMTVRQQALIERKRDAIGAYRDAVTAGVHQLVTNKKIEALADAIAHIGVLKEEIRKAIERLGLCYKPVDKTGDLQTRYTNLLTQLSAPPRNTVYLWAGADANADVTTEVTRTSNDEVFMSMVRALTGGATLTEGSVAEMDRKMGDMTAAAMSDALLESEQPSILNRMARSGVFQLVRDEWQGNWANLVQQALPHVELTADYTTNTAYRICCHQARGEVYAAETQQNVSALIARRVIPAIHDTSWQRWQPGGHGQADHMVIFAYEEPGISTTFLEAYRACQTKYQGGAAANKDATPFWTTKEWVESNGPSLATIDWAETIKFYIDLTATVFLDSENLQDSASNVGPASLFRYGGANNANPYILYTPQGGAVQRINAYADPRGVQEFVRNTGGGEGATSELLQRLNSALMALTHKKALEMTNNVITKELDKAEGSETDAIKRLRVYWAKIRRSAFGQENDDYERALLQEYAWLRV